MTLEMFAAKMRLLVLPAVLARGAINQRLDFLLGAHLSPSAGLG